MLRALNRKIWIKHFVSIFPADWRLQEERVRLPEGPGQLHHEGVRQAGPEEGRTLWLICETSARKKGIIKANINWIYLPRPPSYHVIQTPVRLLCIPNYLVVTLTRSHFLHQFY